MKGRVLTIMLKMQEKWGVKNLTQVFFICAVFSLAGCSVLFLRKAFFDLIGFDEHTPFVIKAITYLVTIFPAFQLLLLIYGFLLGQFPFFWEKERKLVGWITTRFKSKL